MSLSRCALWALAVILVLASPVSISAQSTTKVEELKPGSGEIEPHPNGFVHRSSGYIFPRMLDQVPARKSTTYGQADADVYYTLYGGGNGDGWLNLYVYPATITLAQEISNVTQALVEKTSGQLITAPAEMGKPSLGVLEAWFKGSVQEVDLLTGFRIAQIGNWFIKARVSIPADADPAVFGRVGAALNAIDFQPVNLAPTNSVPTKEPRA